MIGKEWIAYGEDKEEGADAEQVLSHSGRAGYAKYMQDEVAQNERINSSVHIVSPGEDS